MKKIQLALLAASASVALLSGCATQPTASNESKSACGSSARTPASTSEEFEGFNIQAEQGYDGVADANFADNFNPPPPPAESTCDYLTRVGKIDRTTSCKNSLRSNDVAWAYSLDTKGNFFRWAKNPNKNDFTPCQVTNQVESFKLSSHTKDVAVAYYARRTDWNNRNAAIELWHVTDLRDATGAVTLNGACPKTNKPPRPLEANVADYGVTPPAITNTSIVNVTLGRNGVFTGWPYTTSGGNKTYTAKAVKEYAYNACYNKPGKPFSSYQLFLLRENRQVTKIKGTASGDLSEDATTKESYADLGEFRTKMKITQAECDKK